MLLRGVVLLVAAVYPCVAGAESVEWLLERISAGGIIQDESNLATDYQATAESLRTLVESGVDDDRLSLAYEFLASNVQPTTESLGLLATTGLPTSAELAELRRRLRIAQSPDGGFGDGEGYEPSPLETAFAMDALGDGLDDQSRGLAMNYLLNSQNPDGGWGVISGGASSVFVTARVVTVAAGLSDSPRYTSAMNTARSYLLSSRNGQGLWAEQHLSAVSLIALSPTSSAAAELSESYAALAALEDTDGGFAGDTYTTALVVRALARPQQLRASEARLVVQIKDSDTNAGLVGVKVRLDGPSRAEFFSDSVGVVDASGLQTGRYELTAELDDYASSSTAVFLQAGETSDLGTVFISRLEQQIDENGDVFEEPDPDAGPGTVRGRVVDANTGQALSGATINTSSGHIGVTDSSGNFQLSEVDPGTLSFTIARDGYVSNSGEITVLSNRIIFVDGRLVSTGDGALTLFGTVISAVDGQILQGAEISVLADGVEVSAFSDSLGDYRITDITATALEILVTAEGFQPQSVTAEFPLGSEINFSPSMDALGDEQSTGTSNVTLTGRIVRAEDRTPLAGVYLEVFSGGNYADSETDPDGFFELEVGVSDDALEFYAYSDFGGETQLQISAIAGSRVDLGDVLLSDESPDFGGTISGRIVDAETGEPLSGAFLSITDFVEPRRVSVAADGSFTETELYGPRVIVDISLSGYRRAQLTSDFEAPQHLRLGDIALKRIDDDSLKPDLFIANMDRSEITISQGSLFANGALSLRVENQGSRAVEGGFELVAFFDVELDGVYTEQGDILLAKSIQTQNLDVAESVDILLDVRGQAPFPRAPISVQVDPRATIDELVESNNTFVSAIPCRNAADIGVERDVVAIDLALCLDSSGSVNAQDFQLQLEGTARAIENPLVTPHDGSVRLSVMQFSSSTRVEVEPTRIYEENVEDLALQIRDIRQAGGGTAIGDCITTATDLVFSQPVLANGSVIDVSTDGQSDRASTLAAADYALSQGITALNAIGVGAGASTDLLNDMVFPRPAGGESGFVIEVDSFDQYVEGISTKIQQEVQFTDLNVSQARLADNGLGTPYSAVVRVGNPSRRKANATSLRVFQRSGAEVLIVADVPVPELRGGEFADVEIDRLDAFDLELDLVFEVDPQDEVVECDELNNTASARVQDANVLGVIRVETDLGEYTSEAPVVITATVENPGTLAADYSATIRVFAEDGSLVTEFSPAEFYSVSPGAENQASYGLPVTNLLAGNYSATATLNSIRDDESLSVAESSFTVLPRGADENQSASIAARLNRREFNTTDSMQISAIVGNESINEIFDPGEVFFIVINAQAEVVHVETVPAPQLGPGRRIRYESNFAFDPLPPGLYGVGVAYRVSGGFTVVDEIEDVLVKQLPRATLSADVALAAKTLSLGESQTCSFTLSDRGDATYQLNVRYGHALIGGDSVDLLEEREEFLEPDREVARSFSIGAEGMQAGTYACLVEALIDEKWETLAGEAYDVVGDEDPAVQLELSLKVASAPRVLAYVSPTFVSGADSGSVSGCLANRRIELDGSWRVNQFPAGSTLEVSVHDPSGQIVDTESLYLGAGARFPYNENAGSSGVDLQVLQFSSDGVAVALVPSNGRSEFSAERYQFVATARNGTTLEQLNSGVVFPDCRTQTTHNGTRYQDFLVVAGNSDGGESTGREVDRRSDIELLEAILQENGYAYAIADSPLEFARQYRVGGFDAVAMFGAIPDDGSLADGVLREALHAGLDILVAADISSKQGRLANLAIAASEPVSLSRLELVGLQQSTLESVQLNQTLNASTFGLEASVLIRGGAQELPVAAKTRFGQGLATFIGFDLLRLASAEPGSRLEGILHELVQEFAETPSVAIPGGAIPISASVLESEESRQGEIGLFVTTGEQFLLSDGGRATSLSYDFEVGPNTSNVRIERIQLGDSAEATIVEMVFQGSATDTEAGDVSEILVIDAVATRTISDIVAYAECCVANELVLEKARAADASIRAGNIDQALRALLEAADELDRADNAGSDQAFRADIALLALKLSIALEVTDEVFTEAPSIDAPPEDGGAEVKTLFGFESLTGWRSEQVPLSLRSDQATEGLQSMSVPLSGYTRLESREFSPAAESFDISAGSLVGLDVFVPYDQSGWRGNVEVVIRVPSQGLYWEPLGKHDLAVDGIAGWATYEFPASQRIADAISAGSTDAVVYININGSPGASSYGLDNLRVLGTDSSHDSGRSFTSALLSFESSDQWRSEQSLVTPRSSFRTHGQAALEVPISGYTRVTSTPSNVLLGASSSFAPSAASLDIRVPSDQYGWRGNVDLVVVVPSLNLYWSPTQKVDIASRPLGEFSTVEFALPSDVRYALSEHPSDVEIQINLNAASGASPYVIDNLRFYD